MIELMIGIAIIGTLLALAAPSMRDMILNSRMTSQTNDLMSDFALARSMAANRGQRVVMCSSANGTSCGGTWPTGRLLFVDTNTNGSVDVGEEVLKVEPVLSTGTLVTVTGLTTATVVQFRPSGMAVGLSGSTATLALCDGRTGPYGRTITVTPTGRTSVAKSTC